MKRVLESLQRNQTWMLWLGLALICADLVWTFYFMPSGLEFADEPYQILIGKEVGTHTWRDTPLAPLSAWISSLMWRWGAYQLLNFRYLGYSMQVCAILITSFYLWRRTRRRPLAVLAMGASMWLLTLSWWGWSWGWDVVSKLMLAATLTSLLWFLHTKRCHVTALACMCLFSFLAVLSRVPNVLCLPLCALAICLTPWRDKWSVRGAWALPYLLIVILALWVWTVCIYGSVGQYLDNVRVNMVTAHGLRYMLLTLWDDFLNNLPLMALMGLTYLTIYALSKRCALGWTCLCAVALMSLTVYSFWVFSWYVCAMPHLQNSFMFTCLAIAFWRTGSRARWALVWVGLFAVMPMMGSNTGIIKMLNAAALPLICIYLVPKGSRDVWVFAAAFMLCATACSWHLVRRHSFYELGSSYNTATIQSGPMRGLRTSPDSYHIVENAMADVAALRAKGYTIINANYDNRWGWNYLFGLNDVATLHTWTSPDTSAPWLSRMERLRAGDIPERTAVFCVPSYWNFDFKPDAGYEDADLMTALSRTLGRYPTLSDAYTIYVK